MQVRRRLTALAAACTLAAALLGATVPAPAAADTLQDLRNKLRQAQERQAQVEQQRRQTESQLRFIENQVRKTEAEYTRARNELEQARAAYARAVQDLNQAEADLRRAEKELAEVTAALHRRQGLLSKRLRSLYMDGRVKYLEVLLGATSFRDFLSRYHMLQMVVQADRELLQEIRATKAQVERKRAEAEAHRNRMARLEEEKHRWLVLVDQNTRALAQRRQDLNRQREQLEKALDDLDRTSKELEGTIRELEQKIAAELGQLVLSYPVRPARITSYFGSRVHPILRTTRMHNGVDFAANTGQPVYAAADGTVIIAGWQGGYGNTVVISHGKVKGRAISTLYAHNSQLKVTAGQQVKRGQIIALAGSTGLSTGPHVHFEVRVDGVPTNPLDWLGR